MDYREHVFLKLAYVYMTDADYERYETAIAACGWQSTYLFSQFLSSFAGKNIDYYRAALKTAAAAMDIHPKELYNLCRSAEEVEFPQYVKETPEYGESPLNSVVAIETGMEQRRRIGRFKASGRNAVVLRLAAIVERQSTPLTLSRIVNWHFANYWNRSYGPQITNDFNAEL